MRTTKTVVPIKSAMAAYSRWVSRGRVSLGTAKASIPDFLLVFCRGWWASFFAKVPLPMMMFSIQATTHVTVTRNYRRSSSLQSCPFQLPNQQANIPYEPAILSSSPACRYNLLALPSFPSLRIPPSKPHHPQPRHLSQSPKNHLTLPPQAYAMLPPDAQSTTAT